MTRPFYFRSLLYAICSYSYFVSCNYSQNTNDYIEKTGEFPLLFQPLNANIPIIKSPHSHTFVCRTADLKAEMLLLSDIVDREINALAHNPMAWAGFELALTGRNWL